MLVDVIFLAIKAILTPIFAALPTFSLIDTLGITDVGQHIGFFFYQWNGIMPFGELTTFLAALFSVVLACLAAYKFANWIWRHIPDLWGFGPGAG